MTTQKWFHFKHCRLAHPMKTNILWENQELLHTLRHVPWPKTAKTQNFAWDPNTDDITSTSQMIAMPFIPIMNKCWSFESVQVNVHIKRQVD